MDQLEKVRLEAKHEKEGCGLQMALDKGVEVEINPWERKIK